MSALSAIRGPPMEPRGHTVLTGGGLRVVPLRRASPCGASVPAQPAVDIAHGPCTRSPGFSLALPAAAHRLGTPLRSFTRTLPGGEVAPIPVARKGGLPLANSRPIADLRRGEHIVSDVSEPTSASGAPLRVVIAMCCAWELTIGILREGGFRWRQSRWRNAVLTRRGRCASQGQRARYRPALTNRPASTRASAGKTSLVIPAQALCIGPAIRQCEQSFENARRHILLGSVSSARQSSRLTCTE